MGTTNGEVAELYRALKLLQYGKEKISLAQKEIKTTYNQLGAGWNDKHYRELQVIISDCYKALNDIGVTMLQGEKYVLALISQINEYDGINLGGSGSAASPVNENADLYSDGHKPKTLHLSREEVNARWQQTIQNIDSQIENYKEALISRGIPEGTWLNRTLAEHRAGMLEQEGYNLDVASGHMNDTIHSPNAYSYPDNYASFYDSLANEFRSYCLNGTNPNYSTGPEWKNNCQRCVPTYELRRRGVDATVYPSTHGSDHLSYYPFDVWDNPQVISATGTGQTDIEQAMSIWGDGARAQVVVIWDDGFGTSGHTFIAEQRNGTTFFLDPQTNNSDVSEYFEDVLPGHTMFCRIDNLNTSPFINDCFEQEAI